MKNAKQNGFRPGLEMLETRLVPAFISGSTLVIQGGIGNDTVVVTEDHDANTIQVVQNGNTQNFSSLGITTISASLNRGNNSFRYQLGGGSDFSDSKTINVLLGPAAITNLAGSNSATFDLFNDGDDGLAEVEANLTINVTGNARADRVDAMFGEIDDADVTLRTRLGHGNDSVTIALTGDLVDDADVILDLQDRDSTIINGVFFFGGNDFMQVRANEDIDIDDDASLNVTMNGFVGSDRMNFLYDGELDGLLLLRMNGGSGNDTVTANIVADSGSDGDLDAILTGALGTDVVDLVVTGNVNIINAQENP